MKLRNLTQFPSGRCSFCMMKEAILGPAVQRQGAPLGRDPRPKPNPGRFPAPTPFMRCTRIRILSISWWFAHVFRERSRPLAPKSLWRQCAPRQSRSESTSGRYPTCESEYSNDSIFAQCPALAPFLGGCVCRVMLPRISPRSGFVPHF